jgi:hypothetical protein
MFKNSYQSGFLSIFYALGSQPLQIWGQDGAFVRCVLCALASQRTAGRTHDPPSTPRTLPPQQQ